MMIIIIMIQGGPKPDHFWKFMTPVRRYTYLNAELFILSELLF